MAIEDIITRALEQTLTADRTGLCPLCSSRIQRDLGLMQISWECRSCTWAAAMPTSMYEQFLGSEGDR